MNPKLYTLKEFRKLTPWQQGYVVYYQAEYPGSELKLHQHNPYTESTPAWEQFKQGGMAAMLEVQDGEE